MNKQARQFELINDGSIPEIGDLLGNDYLGTDFMIGDHPFQFDGHQDPFDPAFLDAPLTPTNMYSPTQPIPLANTSQPPPQPEGRPVRHKRRLSNPKVAPEDLLKDVPKRQARNQATDSARKASPTRNRGRGGSRGKGSLNNLDKATGSEDASVKETEESYLAVRTQQNLLDGHPQSQAALLSPSTSRFDLLPNHAINSTLTSKPILTHQSSLTTPPPHLRNLAALDSPTPPLSQKQWELLGEQRQRELQNLQLGVGTPSSEPGPLYDEARWAGGVPLGRAIDVPSSVLDARLKEQLARLDREHGEEGRRSGLDEPSVGMMQMGWEGLSAEAYLHQRLSDFSRSGFQSQLSRSFRPSRSGLPPVYNRGRESPPLPPFMQQQGRKNGLRSGSAGHGGVVGGGILPDMRNVAALQEGAGVSRQQQLKVANQQCWRRLNDLQSEITSLQSDNSRTHIKLRNILDHLIGTPQDPQVRQVVHNFQRQLEDLAMPPQLSSHVQPGYPDMSVYQNTEPEPAMVPRGKMGIGGVVGGLGSVGGLQGAAVGQYGLDGVNSTISNLGALEDIGAFTGVAREPWVGRHQ